MKLTIDQAIAKMNKAAQANIRRHEKMCNIHMNPRAGEHYKHKAIEYMQISKMLEAYKMIIEPQLPYMESDGCADGYPVWDYYCPECGHDFEEEQPTFCPDCGTRIDWTMEEDEELGEDDE